MYVHVCVRERERKRDRVMLRRCLTQSIQIKIHPQKKNSIKEQTNNKKIANDVTDSILSEVSARLDQSVWCVLFRDALVCKPTCITICRSVCCSVLQCVAVCCSVLQCVAVCCSVLQCVIVWCSVLQCGAESCSVLQSVAVCCSVLQCVRVHRTLGL